VFITGDAGENVSLIAPARCSTRADHPDNAATLGKDPEGTAKYTGSFFAERRVPSSRG